MKLLRSEWVKLITSQSSRLLLWTVMAVSIVLTIVSIPGAGPDQQTVNNLFTDTIYLSWIWALVLGVLLVTNEFRHGTAVATFLATPKRGAVLVSKMVVAGIGGALLHGVAIVMAFITATFAIGAIADAPGPEISVLINALSGLSLVGFGNGMLGVAVGMLIRNQLISLAVLFGWLFLGESIVGAPLGALAAYLPAQLMPIAVSLDWGAVSVEALLAFERTPLLALILVPVYALVVAVIASFTTLRKDID
jgi:ABC-type transport system involved in multi-copper enzyme maturation permease subunit